MKPDNATYSKWRERLWPIYGQENWKFISMVMMLSAALFSYTTVRITKDALIVTAPGSDAAVLNFLKGYVVMPLSLVFVLFYSFMSNRVTHKNLFYIAIAPFLIFFAIFTTVLYPFSNYIHMSTDRLFALQDFYPRLRYVFPIIGYWSYSLFYVFAELWGNVSITLLFWQFANLNCTSDEVKRFYPLFGAYGNIGLISAGFIQRRGISTELTCITVLLAVSVVAFTYWWTNTYVLPYEKREKAVEKTKKPKVKVSLMESFKIILNSRYLRYIAIIVLAYNVSVNLAEVTWKTKIKELYPDKHAYQAFMGNFFLATGFTTLFIGLFVKKVVSKFGWLFAAMMTPTILIITTYAFFGFTIFSSWLLPLSIVASGWPLMLAVIIGAVQNIAGKSTKYALFDPTTQMTYIPLDDDLRIKGKAAIDVLGSRWGKSLGGHIQSFLLFITGFSQLQIAPFLLIIFSFVIFAWIGALQKLYVAYQAKLDENKKGVV